MAGLSKFPWGRWAWAWLAIAATLLTACAGPAPSSSTRVIDGVVDLATVSLLAQGEVPLEGTWQAAWNTPLEDPLPSGAPLQPFAVPGRILEQPHPPSWENGTGSATFVVRLRGLDPTHRAEIFVPSNPPSTFTCTSVEGTTTFATLNGPVWREGYESLAAYTVPLPPSRDITCMMHIRTIHWAEGQHAGIWEPPVLVPLGDGARRLTQQITKFAVLVGFLVLLAVFIGVEWVLRPRERAPLYISVMGFGAALWLMNFGHLLDGSGLSHVLRNRIEYGAIPVCTCGTLMAAQHLVGAGPARRRRATVLLGAVATVGALVVPQEHLFLTLRLAQLASLGTAVFIAELALRALFASPRTGDALLLALGLLTPAFLGVGDIVITTLFDARVGLTIYGVAVLALMLAVVLAKRNARVRLATERYGEATSRFVPTEFLRALGHEDVTTARLGDARTQHVSVVFADIRNFTALSERLSPAETFAFLNGCLSRLGPLVRANGGFVDKYIGDAIMALFPSSPSDAVRAAVAMVAQAKLGLEREVRLGVGVHVGDVMMGTIGESERFEATVISDAVNLTARLESLTKQLGCSILVSGEAYGRLEASLTRDARRLGTFSVKGKRQPVVLYEIFSADPPELHAAKAASRTRFDELLTAYAEARFERALDIAGDLRDACPEDGPANWWFLRLLREFTEDAPHSGGVVTLEEK